MKSGMSHPHFRGHLGLQDGQKGKSRTERVTEAPGLAWLLRKGALELGGGLSNKNWGLVWDKQPGLVAGTLLGKLWHRDMDMGRCWLLRFLIFVAALVLAAQVEGQAGSIHSITNWATGGTNNLNSDPSPWALPGAAALSRLSQRALLPSGLWRLCPKKRKPALLGCQLVVMRSLSGL